MITEPELDGEGEPQRPAEVAEPGAGAGPSTRPPARPWLWALGGAVLASAVWVGALAAQNRFTTGPRIDYRHSEELCKEAPLTTLGSLAGGFEKGRQRHGEGPALDWSSCTYEPMRTERRAGYYGRVQVDLHKKTDPGPEFGAQPGLSLFMDVVPGEAEQVPGLGERALISGHAMEPRLQVLDGGAVFTLTVQWFGQDGDAEADEDALTSAMIEDMRALILALKK
ncbi:hypothetical protein [Streptomyces sp. ISL-94]|uniref:hypothetical protein n=1 Tax=Streptomyces sp. ISL-94 TaxID=2819190 RepID=UPI001BEBA8B1|nr:hypothetical protein [Streptomyces sp. ISL-94]MBT2478059.1 hypothetical protein [Streptomyces sp. ISL-94]